MAKNIDVPNKEIVTVLLDKLTKCRNQENNPDSDR